MSIYAGAVPSLMVSKKVLRWVKQADVHIQASFHAARLFAERALPEAVARLERFEPLVVFHCNSLLVIIFDRGRERFCIVAFFVDERDPTPPEGPQPPFRRQPVAYSLIFALGLLDDVASLSRGRSDWLEPGGPVNFRTGAIENSVLRESRRLTERRLDSREPRRVPHTLTGAGERDSQGSRSNCFPGVSQASESTPVPLDGRHRCLSWLNRGDRSFTDHWVD